MRMKLALQQELEDKIALLFASYVEDLDEDYLFQQMFSSDEGIIISYFFTAVCIHIIYLKVLNQWCKCSR